MDSFRPSKLATIERQGSDYLESWVKVRYPQYP